MSEPVLELRDATVLRGGRRILDGVSLRVEAGEHTAIVGPNGSGKSTLMKLLTHEHYPLAPADGSSPVRVLGRERWNVAELRGQLGIVSGELQARLAHGAGLGPVRALDAVLGGFFASETLFLHHAVTEEMRGRARAALERVGAARLAGRRVGTLSTGEARRVLIARALVTEPRVLVLDEPTSGLDVAARHDFLERLRALASPRLTLLLVTHAVEEILPEIRRVVLLRGGRVAHDGPPAEALTSARLGALFGAPLRVHERGGRFRVELEPRPAGAQLTRRGVRG